MTFSDEIYTVVPGSQNLEAWLYVAANAPAASLSVNITLERLPIVTPTANNSLINGNFETGTFYGWDVIGVCTIDDMIVHSGRYSAYISDAVWDSWIDQTLMIPANDTLQFTGWIYPTEVGWLDGYACSSAVHFIFYDRTSMTKAFEVYYMWCGYPPSNTTSQLIKTQSFDANAWNYLSSNLSSDILSYFKGIDLSQFVLHDVILYYHYSNTSPGSYYADDLSLSATASS